jgi:protein transport protein SEC13
MIDLLDRSSSHYVHYLFSLFPRRIFSSTDRTIQIYNVSDSAYERTATLTIHSGPVWQVAWAHPQFGTLLASCSLDGSVAVHQEVRPSQWIVVYHAVGLHASSVNSVAFAPPAAGLMLAAASADGRVSILRHVAQNQTWSVEYIENVGPAGGVNAVHWDPESSAATGVLRLVIGSCDHAVRIFSYAPDGTWQPDAAPMPPSPHSDWVRDVAWAPALLPNHPTIASASEDGSVYIWTTQAAGDSDDDHPQWVVTHMHTFQEPVWRVSWSVTGHMLAVSSGDATVTLWKRKLTSSTGDEWVQVETTADEATTPQ